MDDNIRGILLLLLPLYCLTLTSGHPPTTRLNESNSSTLMVNSSKPLSSVIMNGSEGLKTFPSNSSSSTPTTDRKKSTNSIESNASTSPTVTSPLLGSQDLTQQHTDLPIHSPLVQTNITKVPLRGKCNISIQCSGDYTECKGNLCRCQPGYLPRSDNGWLCGDASLHHVEIPQADPTMIGVVVGLALMSVTLCVVLRLFAKARFRENRTIFNTPNPRLMNVSLLKGGSKTLLRGNSAPRSRRGSTASGRSGIEPGTPTSPVGDHGHPHPHLHHDHGNGNAMALAGSSSRPKPTRQMSTDTVGEGTPTSRHPGHPANKKFRHQDSVASNV